MYKDTTITLTCLFIELHLYIFACPLNNLPSPSSCTNLLSLSLLSLTVCLTYSEQQSTYARVCYIHSFTTINCSLVSLKRLLTSNTGRYCEQRISSTLRILDCVCVATRGSLCYRYVSELVVEESSDDIVRVHSRLRLNSLLATFTAPSKRITSSHGNASQRYPPLRQRQERERPRSIRLKPQEYFLVIIAFLSIAILLFYNLFIGYYEFYSGEEEFDV